MPRLEDFLLPSAFCLLPFVALVAAVPAFSDPLPGFRLESVATGTGFVSSVVVDSVGTIYFTTTDGWIHRVAGTQSERVASLPTKALGNGGLLGMALLDDTHAIVHYTTWSRDNVIDDVISNVDLQTGIETVIRSFVSNIDVPSYGSSSEHHGGNPIVAPDGAIFVGIGDYAGRTLAQKPEWNGGKIWRIDPSGEATQWALGVRNPYDLAWDPELQKVVVADNGPTAGDEIHIIADGSNCGWPMTFGNEPQREGTSPPDYVFPDTIAPTGLLRLSGRNATLRRGYLLGAFVTQSVYYFPDLASAPVPDPIPILTDAGEYVIDIAEGPGGEIYLAFASFPETARIVRLHVAVPGDGNADGIVDGRDLLPVIREISDGGPHAMTAAHLGENAGAFSCDVNADNVIDEADLDTLLDMIPRKRRSSR